MVCFNRMVEQAAKNAAERAAEKVVKKVCGAGRDRYGDASRYNQTRASMDPYREAPDQYCDAPDRYCEDAAQSWENMILAKDKRDRAIELLDEECYDQDSVRNGRSVAEFVTTVFHLAQDAGLGATDCLAAAYYRIAPRLREALVHPTRHTTLGRRTVPRTL